MAEDSQIKVIINDSGRFIVPQIHLAFFSGSQNKQVILLIKRNLFCYMINPFLTKMVGH